MMKHCDYEVHANDTRIRTADKSEAIRTENEDEIDDFFFELIFMRVITKPSKERIKRLK